MIRTLSFEELSTNHLYLYKGVHMAGTTFLVGKKASLDGTTLIARNEDGGDKPNPQRFVVINPENQPKHYRSIATACEFDLPENPLSYTSTPDADSTYGIWAAAGINSENVAMTATETSTTNSRILGLDPYVETGLGEEDFTTITLPYIQSAREGVERMGQLLEKYGTYESNGMAFSDKDEIWWLETLGGHQWAAIRIPDDAYVIAPNRLNIDWYDFESSDTIYSTGLKEFIDKNKLNPDFDGYNLRHIFGSSTIKDTRYNNPRAWYVQNYFSPETTGNDDPFNQDLPFICHANRKISIEEIKFVMSSHYENTAYDPYSTTSSAAEQKLIRPIGLNRNLELHVLQIRDNIDKELAGIHWLAFGPNSFNSLVPFYARVSDTPTCYRDTKADFDPTKMYWLTTMTAVLGDSNFQGYVDKRDTFDLNTMAKLRALQNETDKGSDQSLEAVNEKLAQIALTAQTELLGKMVISGSNHMKLRFDFND